MPSVPPPPEEPKLPPSPPPRPLPAGVWLLGALSAVLLVALVVVARRPLLPPSATSNVEVTASPNVVLAVRALSRLETVDFHMERVVELTDQQTHLYGLIESKDAILLVAVGDVVAGIDLSAVGADAAEVDWTTRTVRLRLPPPEIFAATLDNARTHVVLRSTDRLATRREDLEGMARKEAEARLRAAAIDAGILKKASENAEREVDTLLRSMGFERVQVETRTPLLPDLPLPGATAR